MPPEVIGGRYRVGRAIGQGGMGTVWLCRDEILRRDVAVKQVGMLPGESVPDSARALREARSSAALSHRNVVTVFDVVEEGGAIWLVMEHVPSRSLAEMIREDGPLEPATVADIGAQVADGLAAAHAAGTMHRDVKPGNILVRDDGVAKISDFGIARSAGDLALTQSGFLTGTPSYFSPELARGAAPGAAADVWALGATLYAAVEGRPPYPRQDSPIAVLHDIARRQPPPPRRAEFLEPVLLRMLDRDPGTRWSMDDAAHSLHRLAGRHAPAGTATHTAVTGAAEAAPAVPLDVPAPAAPSRRSPPSVPSYRPRRARGRRLVLLAALLAVGGAIGYAVSRDDGTDRPDAAAQGAEPSPTSSPTGSPASSPTSSAPAKAAFVRGYFAVAPGGTAAAWAQLGPNEQAQGRASYDRFWQGIRSVGVSGIRPVEGTDSVEVTLTYHTTGGRVSVERQRLDLVRSDDGGYLIDNDEPAG